MKVPAIPRRLENAIIFLRGERDGRAWLTGLPGRIDTYARRWGLTLHAIADSGAMSCCVYCTGADGRPAVLKIPVDDESGRTEIQLLRRWELTDAAPVILQNADDCGVFLMTRVLPGTIVWPGGDHVDSIRFGDLLTSLNKPDLPAPPRLKDLADIAAMRLNWARERFSDAQYADAISRTRATAHLVSAEFVLAALLRSTTRRHILHADLQAKNILQGHRHWYAIDPLGAIGDINAEAALWIAIQDGPSSILRRLTELDGHPLLNRNRLRAWTYTFAVAEYRPYLPASGKRIETFISGIDLDQLVAAIETA